MPPRWLLSSAIALALLVPVGACGPSDRMTRDLFGQGTQESSKEVVVFAAASLTEPFIALGERFEVEHPGTKVTFNFASSSELAVQISRGAPADLYASADEVQMRLVQEANMARPPIDFATNRVVVVTPADNPAGISSAEDLARTGVKVVLAAPELPAGNYARQILSKLGIQAEVEQNIVSSWRGVRSFSRGLRMRCAAGLGPRTWPPWSASTFWQGSCVSARANAC